MEHSLLHGLQVISLVLALGGVFFRFLVLSPAVRKAGVSAPFAAGFSVLIDRFARNAALGGAVAALLDIFVQVAELEGQTIYTGINLPLLVRYVSTASVAQISVLKALLLLAAGMLAGRSKILTLLLLLAAAATFPLVSHSAALPQAQVYALVAQFLHLLAASIWIGMLAFVSLLLHRAPGELLERAIQKFTPWACASVFLIALSGVYSACRFIHSPGAMLASAYGLTLLVKLLLLCFAIFAGFQNWRLARTRQQTSQLRRFSRLVELELSAGFLMLITAGILGAISPPLEPGTAQLNRSQINALLSPRFPSARFINPATFVGAADRTENDLRYAEFTHQWSGVFVILLGLCWLGQALIPQWRNLLAKWPILLVPFGCFIAIVADPEVWILRTFSLQQVLSDPQVLEHQLGALLVFILAGLALRDRHRPARLQPLGYSFPIIVIAGSLMLLGHAHSNLGASEELSSLINMEHAVIGGLGLFAGVCRWFQLRDLPGASCYRFAWPALIILAGVFMAFFYRELTPPDHEPANTNYSMISRLR